MLVVDALVHEGRHQQRDADDQVPDKPEPRNGVRLDVRELMDEAARAVERENCDRRPRRWPTIAEFAKIAANRPA